MTGASEAMIATGITVDAVHYWPDAPKHRDYLGTPHMHTFRINVTAKVEGHDREIEFHDLRDQLDVVVFEHLDDFSEGYHSFGSRSCEQIAQEILDQMPNVWEARVFEDTNNGSIVARAREPEAIDLTPPRRLVAHNVITICGSTRFKADTLRVARKLVAEGWIVEMVEFFAHADEIEMTDEAKARVDQIHKDKIRSSHAIYVVNPGGYVGSSTRSEIDLAQELGLQIMWLEKPEGVPA